MYRIALINMPFANLAMPSIALTQLQSVIKRRFGSDVLVDIYDLNHQYAKYLSFYLYEYLTNSRQSLTSGFGEWFFRRLAFPEAPDNAEQYFARYFPVLHQPQSGAGRGLRALIDEKRDGLDAFTEELIRQHDLFSANLVGLTSMFMQNLASFALARKLKQHNPKLLVVMGGANCEFPMGRAIAENVAQVDFTFSGPALKSFPQFVGNAMSNDLAKCSTLGGVFTRDMSSQKSGRDTLGEEEDINELAEPDYKSFIRTVRENFPNGEIEPILPFETSRGCWWGERAHCTFCGLNGETMGFRAMEPSRAVHLLNSLFQYEGRVSYLTAVDNILPKNYFEKVLPMIQTPPSMSLFYEVKADLSEKDVAMLANSRVLTIQPGIEALVTSTLKLMKKGTTAFQNINLLKLCALYGVVPNWNILVGFPGETAEVYQRYVDIFPLVVHLPPPIGVNPIRFDRYSPYYMQAKAFGLELTPMDFYGLVYPFKQDALDNLAYYFSDRNAQADYAVTVQQWIGKLRSGVLDWKARWTGSKLLPPRLYFKNSTTVYDSRSGKAIDRVVGEAGAELLRHLARPVRQDDLLKPFSGARFDVTEQLDLLKSYGLIFQEGDRLLSLVLEGDHGSGRPEGFMVTAPVKIPERAIPVQLEFHLDSKPVLEAQPSLDQNQ